MGTTLVWLLVAVVAVGSLLWAFAVWKDDSLEAHRESRLPFALLKAMAGLDVLGVLGMVGFRIANWHREVSWWCAIALAAIGFARMALYLVHKHNRQAAMAFLLAVCALVVGLVGLL